MTLERRPSVARVRGSFGFALAGLLALVRGQPNVRVHIASALVVLALAAALRLAPLEIAVLALTIGLVFVAEGLNTAIESAVDLASPSHHPLAREAKDVAAGAVLVSAVTAVVVGAVLLGPRLLALLRA